MVHWADVIAGKLAEQGDKHVIATGITPSGPIHVGNMREVLTADLIVRACEEQGLDAELVYIKDNADPLRKVYPFLESDEFEQHVGRALAEIPSPDGSGNYADYFLQPFFDSLDELGVDFRVVDVFQSYKDGCYTDCVKTSIENRDQIKEILETTSGRPLADDWFPYNPTDDEGRQHGLKVTHCEWPWVEWVSEDGREGRTNIERGNGKLPWRLDWAARWNWIGVTFEAYGKDHSAAGGSWDTGVKLSPLYGSPPPMGMMYEWIYLKGKGAMASSTGVAMSGRDLLNITPPEIMRYLVSRVKPEKHIDFDPGEGLISLADELERLETKYHRELKGLPRLSIGEGTRAEQQALDDARRFELAQVSRSGTTSDSSLGVSFKHLSLLCQVRADDDDVLSSLARSHEIETADPRLTERIGRMRNWIASEWFPETAKIRLVEAIDWEALDDEQAAIVKSLGEALQDCEWEAEAVKHRVSAVISDSEMKPRDAFQSFYTALLGKSRGPALAPLLAEYERDRVTSLFS